MINWFAELIKIKTTDPKAKDLFELLKKASTEDEKTQAKATAKAYIESICKEPEPITVPKEEIPAPKVIEPELPKPIVKEKPVVEETPVYEATDLSAPAFNPRYAKWGLNREEELFLKGVLVRPMKREERIKFRSAINAKKYAFTDKLQADFRAKQKEQAIKDASDPEKIKFNNNRVFVKAICEELQQNHNIEYILRVVDNLTVETLRDLLKQPENEHAFTTYDKDFVANFYKKYGE